MLTFSLNKSINEMYEKGTVNMAMPKSELGKEWLSEAIIKAVDGKKDKPDAFIDVDRYAHGCAKNSELTVNSRQVSMLNSSELEGGARGVSESVAYFVETNIDAIVESSEVQTLVTEFLEVQEDLIIEEGINLWNVLSMARNANANMIEKLRTLIAEFGIGSLVEDILRNPECMVKLEEVMA